MSDHYARAQLVHLEVQRLALEATSCTDLDRLVAIRREMEVLYDSMLEIRREQLCEQIERENRPAVKRGLLSRMVARARRSG